MNLVNVNIGWIFWQLYQNVTFVISSVLCYMNNSFKHKPLYKKGNSEMIENHRSISLLSSFSEPFGLITSKHLLNFMNKCKFFSGSQHEYLTGCSIQTAIFQFIQAVLGHLKIGDIALGMFLDLSNAYD